jgi:replication-associated recombination protein RarA
MKPSKLYEALHALIGERVPLHIWGACGVGKSQIVAQVARDLGNQLSSTCAPCNSIRSICAVCPGSKRTRPSGFRPSSCPTRVRAFSFWTS